MNKFINHIGFYLVFLIPSVLIVGLIFTTLIANHLWYEWDSIPIVDLFTLPSVHTQSGAHFNTPAILVYSIWIVFLAITFILPEIATRLVLEERRSIVYR